MLTAALRVWENPYVRVLVGLLLLVGLFLLLSTTVLVWGSVLGAFLLAFLLNPVVAGVQRLGLGRGGGVAVVVVLFLLFLLMLWVLAVSVAAQFSDFIAELPAVVERLEEVPFQLARLVDDEFGALFQQVYVTTLGIYLWIADEFLPSLLAAQAGGGGVLGQLAMVAGGGIQFAVILVLTLYLLLRYPAYNRSLLRAFPERHRELMAELAEKASFSVGGYIRGQIVIAFCVGVLTWIGLTLVGIPLAAALGLLAGAFNIIPLFGPLIASVPTAFIAMTIGWNEVIFALLVLFLANQVDAHILTPIVLSRTIEVDPVTIIVAILLGSALFGLWGAILAVPIAVFVKLLYTDYYLTSDWYAGRKARAATKRDET